MVRILGTKYAKGPGNDVVQPELDGQQETRKNSPNLEKPLISGKVHLKQPKIEVHKAAKYENYYIYPLRLKFLQILRFGNFKEI